jgi:hypothetical protein
LRVKSLTPALSPHTPPPPFLFPTQGSAPVFLGSMKDTNHGSMEMYKLEYKVPDVAPGSYIVQSIYYTNNPQAPAAFYQCADVQIFKPNTTAAAKAHVHQH